MPRKENLFIVILSNCIKAFLIALLLTIGIGYLTGFNVKLVDGGSAEPYIHYRSIAVVYKCDIKDLKIGDFVTFTETGASFVTHQVVSIDEEKDEICIRGWNYNSKLKERVLQEHTDVKSYSKILGRVVYANYMIGNSIFTIRENVLILVGLFAMIVLSFIVKEQLGRINEYV